MKSIYITYDVPEKSDSNDRAYEASVSVNNESKVDFMFMGDEIIDERPDSDSEDNNDTARWLIKTLIKILYMEKIDEDAHCDWSADCEKSTTGKYKFNVSLEKIGE